MLYKTLTIIVAVVLGFGLKATFAQEAERFVPNGGRFTGTATVELRGEATIYGRDVRLRQVCRWSDQDKAVMEPVAELVLMRMETTSPFRTISLQDIKSTLHDAGVNLAGINFVGAVSCTINRSDVAFDEGAALEKWLAKDQRVTEGRHEGTEARRHDVLVATTQPAESSGAGASLQDVLLRDLATRLGVGESTLQMAFSPQDSGVLRLREPAFSFGIEPTRARSLGTVSWNVQIKGGGNEVKKMTVVAVARAWQEQVVLARPVAHKQIIQDEDVAERRVLVDRLTDEPLLKRKQAVGQQASREMKPGQVLTARTVDPVPLAQPGQLISVTVNRGGVQVQAVARAMDTGSYGQTIRAKNEATKDVMEVTLTGPQRGVMGAAPTARAE